MEVKKYFMVLKICFILFFFLNLTSCLSIGKNYDSMSMDELILYALDGDDKAIKRLSAGGKATALRRASSDGRIDIVKKLVSNGAEVNQYFHYGFDVGPLSRAAENGHKDVVEYLISAGADVNNEDLQRAEDNGHIELAMFMREKYMEKTNTSDPALFEVELTADGKGAVIVGYKENYKYISVPEIIEGYPVKEIRGAFSAKAIRYIELPNSLEVIGIESFSYNKLTDVVIPDSVKEIGKEAFAYNKLKHINIPNSVKEIGDKAFCNCESLESIDIPNSVKSIGYQAFKDCINLKSVKFPDSEILIGNEAFRNCGMQKLTINGKMHYKLTNGKSETFSGLDNLDTVVIAKDVKTLPDGADHIFFISGFISSRTLKTVIFESPATIIEKNTFGYCPNLSLASQAEIKKHIK